MKKAILLITCMGLVLCVLGQETVPEDSAKPRLTREEYLAKSKSQKIGGMVLTSAGGIMTLIGIITATNELGNDLGGIFDPDYKDDNNETLSGVLVIGGLAAIAGGIILLVSSQKNQRRAINISLENEPVTLLRGTTIMRKPIPSLKLTIPF